MTRNKTYVKASEQHESKTQGRECPKPTVNTKIPKEEVEHSCPR